MHIAVASKTGIEVDQHFGHAERFLIYDCASETPRLVEEVQVDRYCSFDPENPMRHRQFDDIVAALKDCSAVVTAMIGVYPKQELHKVGIEALTASGPIDQALLEARSQLQGKVGS